MILCSSSRKRLVSITTFKRGGEASFIQGHLEDRLTKKEMLEKVSEWWDSHGTGLDDYDGIRIIFKKKGEQGGEETKGN